MLNISNNSISERVKRDEITSLKYVESKVTRNLLLRILKWSFFLLLVVALLPWRQNIRSNGQVSTLRPEQRPQTIQSVIDGQIIAWQVQEGQQVKKGDTIAVLTEVKDAYLDVNLLDRTQDQLELKREAAQTYALKEGAQDQQLNALLSQQGLKLQQAELKLKQAALKVENDSISLKAAQIDYATAKERYRRMDSLYQRGLKSLTDLESRNLVLQKAQASLTGARNSWDASKMEYFRLRVDLSTLRAEYDTYYAKALSERLTTSTNRLDAESSIAKLENQYSNYRKRQEYHAIIAPQDAYITELFVNGLGETVKAGQKILSMMPSDYDLAVEVYVDPIDLPLMHVGEKVRLQFDGWPAIVFSGWPDMNIGTYSAEIYAIDQFINAEGKYRILLRPDAQDVPWPNALRVGSGASAMILLREVPIWYELWRKANGFPPEFYSPKTKNYEKK
jgi:multidrug resistance efflux pump